jgi:hypothetical protein
MQKHGINIPFAEPTNFSADTGLLNRLGQWSKYLVYIVLLISLSVWTGWLLQIDILLRPFRISATMNPMTGVCFLLFCFSFLVLHKPFSFIKNRITIIAILFFVSSDLHVFYSIQVGRSIKYFFQTKLKKWMAGSQRAPLFVFCF